jgi:hypothetical protein
MNRQRMKQQKLLVPRNRHHRFQLQPERPILAEITLRLAALLALKTVGNILMTIAHRCIGNVQMEWPTLT